MTEEYDSTRWDRLYQFAQNADDWIPLAESLDGSGHPCAPDVREVGLMGDPAVGEPYA